MVAPKAVEVSIALADLPPGQVRVAGDDEAKALFVRDEHGIRAFSAICPHYHLPLDEARLCAGRIVCPFHKASFEASSGRLADPPALHGLDHYPVRLEGARAVATLSRIKRGTDATGTLEPSAVNTVFVIVGTGAAGTQAAVALRRHGFVGAIVMIGQEDEPPYDRPSLSKEYLGPPPPDESLRLEPGDFALTYGIQLVHGRVVAIEVGERRVTLADGQSFKGDAILVATGSHAVRPDLPGTDLDNVFTLRSFADARRFSAAARPGRRAVVIGGGFIGLEAGSFLCQRGLQATVVAREPVPMAGRLGADVANGLVALQREKGVVFELGQAPVALEPGPAGAVRGVRLADGRLVEADLVLLATGSRPATEALRDVDLAEDGGVPADAYLAIGDSVYVAGDIAAWPERHSGTRARIEHWRVAGQQGMRAARNMLGLREPFEEVPFFWSNQAGHGLDYAGHAPGFDRVILHGEPARADFIAFYVKDGRALAASSINRKAELIAFMQLLKEDRVPPVEALAAGIELASLVDPAAPAA